MLPLYQTTAVDARHTSAPHMKSRQDGNGCEEVGGGGAENGVEGAEVGGWSGGRREGWTGRTDGCQAPNFPAQMEPNTVQHQPSSPQTVRVCVKDACVGNFKVCL